MVRELSPDPVSVMSSRRRSPKRRSRSRTPDSRYRSSPKRAGHGSADSRRYDSYDDYSDSFVSADDDDRRTYTHRSNRRRNPSYSYRKGGKNTYKSRSNVKSKMAGGGRMSNVKQRDYVTKRVHSARRLNLKQLKSEVEELQAQLTDLLKENKVLRQLQTRQEKALDKFEGNESDLPRLIESHSRETRSLREQIRKHKERHSRAERKLRDTEDELRRTKKQLKKLEDLSGDKSLAERDELSRKLYKLEADSEESSMKAQNLERYVDNLTKNHKTELTAEMVKHRETMKKYKQLQEEFGKLQLQVKEKDKELEIKNIYSNRIIKAPHRLSSTQSSPTPLPPLGKQKKQRAISTSPNISPREKAKQFEENRQDDERRQREERDRKEKRRASPVKSDSFAENTIQEETEDEGDSFFITQDGKENSFLAAAEKRDHEEKERRQREEKERENLRRKKDKEEDKMRKERERIKRQSEERANKEKRERERVLQDERERKEREEAERRGREERIRREREEQDRKEREEAERLANDAQAQAERKKKDLLLAKLKDMDSGNSTSPPLSRKVASSTSSPKNNKKVYNFTQPVENMHNGKPSHDDVTVPVIERQKRNSSTDPFGDDFSGGGYQPSFTAGGGSGRGTRNSSPKTDKKTNLMSSLFGEDKNKDTKGPSFGDDDIFSSSTKAKPVSDKKAYPWDQEAPTSNRKGNDVFSDNHDKNSPLLPRRPRQTNTTTLHNKPTVNAIDDIDDEIEEVIL